MDFAKHLFSQGHSFNFTLKTDNFSFNLDITKKRTPLIMTKKKPSTLARNAKQKNEFLAKKRSPKSSDAEEMVVAALDTPGAKCNLYEVNDLETLEETTFSCDLCEFIGKSSIYLKINKNRKHQNIPGGYSDNKDTDCWWEKKFSNSLKMFHVCKDVLMDIEESPLLYISTFVYLYFLLFNFPVHGLCQAPVLPGTLL